jgi:cytoskeletal protein RodZ
MSTLSEDLRAARQREQLTLQQVADLTLVNVKFLEAIDRGDYSFLPQAYVRAFLREYAQIVGIDPQEAMERYEKETAPAPPPPREPAEVEAPARSASPEPATPGGFAPRPAWLVTAAIAIFTLVVIVLALQEHPAEEAVEEIPFRDMVRQNEQRAAANLPERPQPLPEEILPADSLTLLAVTLDSVWVQIVVDTQDPREYIFPPNRRARWKARNRFVVTVGNAGGIQFTLNQTSLGTLGVSGAVVRNVEFNRRSLDREQ